MVRVGLLWHSLSSGNLGVRALTLSQLHILDETTAATGRRVEVALFGHPRWGGLPNSPFVGERVSIVEGCDLTAARIFGRPREVLARFRACDLLLDIGEGDSFTDVYGGRRYLKQVAVKLLALRSGRPLVLAPQTIGPFSGRLREWPVRHILRRAARVFARDSLSADYARRLGRGDTPELTDLAFALPCARPAREAGGSVRVGLNVSGLLHGDSGGRSPFGLRLSYPDLIESLIGAFTAMPDVELLLIPHVLSPPGAADQDIAVAEMLAARHPAITALPPFQDPRDAKSCIAGLDFFIGARMHACIAAFSAGVPLLPLAYTRKSTGLFRSLGYDLVGDMTAAPLDTVRDLALDAFARRDALRAAIRNGNRLAEARLALYRDELGGLLAAIA